MTRDYLIARELHIDPSTTGLSAVELDELLFLHSKVQQFEEERRERDG